MCAISGWATGEKQKNDDLFFIYLLFFMLLLLAAVAEEEVSGGVDRKCHVALATLFPTSAVSHLFLFCHFSFLLSNRFLPAVMISLAQK